MKVADSHGLGPVRRSFGDCARRIALATLFAAQIALCPMAFAIVRIGNAKFGSVELGFEATLARPFMFARELPDDGALLVSQGDGVFRDGETLSIRTLEAVLPESMMFSRQDFRSVFAGDARKRTQWQEVKAPLGVEAFVGESNGRLFGVASWGPGRGIVLTGGIDPMIRSAIAAMLASIDAQEGACPWE